MLVKPQFYNDTQAIFQGTGIQISTDGCEYLGGAIGTDAFVRKSVEEKIALWKEEIECLTNIAGSYPWEAYAALTGVMSR